LAGDRAQQIAARGIVKHSPRVTKVNHVLRL